MAKVMLRVGGGEKPSVPVKQEFDIRDVLSGLVAKGNTLTPDDKAALYGSLVSKLGEENATKVMSHAYLFNQRPDVQKLPLEERINAFYTVGSNDPYVNSVINKTKTLGYGVLPGFRESASGLNQEMAGLVGSPSARTRTPEAQRRIMLQVRK